MRLHSNSTTNLKQRLRIQSSCVSYARLARQLGVSKATIHRWKHRTSPMERSCRPGSVVYALSPEEETLVLSLRKKDLPLDDVVDAVRFVLPHVCRASVHRLFVRHGLGRLPKKEQPDTGQPGTFKEYGPGYLHIDCFYLPQVEGTKRYCFVAVDRATRLALLAIYEYKDKEAATAFLGQCLKFYPFRIEKVLTDNGREFTLQGFKNRYGTAKSQHTFDVLCQQEDIEHRLTRPYTPKTNGLVERMNGLIKENTTKKHRYQTAEEMIADLQRWMVQFNFCRINRRIGRRTPYQAACLWYQKQPDIYKKKPESLLAYRSQGRET
jgi:transposase InsO family protein